MSYGEARIAALRRKQDTLDGRISAEQGRPSPNSPRLAELQRQKSKVRAEISRLQCRRIHVG